ncbi:type II CAAX prenyl endopeptidase Rce1 family protein [Natronogracilivirga saccharolytica]|uniref:CPBP family intramembrane metalloprotease n=1 Tax=Natronogracilivirga saccharolytica TaxID=2812953 RepID=A0A8J7UWW6_9BACT|nr:CPBP family intramembrane glutamic endopeptidase [Natronogracilivirga saccharolytica]MBP3192684.1 CPBP family intramembrane metalloprotease [Natronogracilivirga saccharolytica]
MSDRHRLLEPEFRYIGWSPGYSLFHKLYLSLEFIFLFLAIPALIFYDLVPFSKIGLLLGFTLLCAFILWRDGRFNRKKLWNTKGVRKSARGIFMRFIPAAVFLAIIILMLEPDQLFNMVRNDFGSWLFVVIAYPLFSVYPQEVIYRGFVFHRYEPIFPKQRFMIHVNALSFGYLHIIFGNYPAVFLTYGAGYLFARTYAETKSLLAVSLEHALYGILIFTIGFNDYFLNSVVLDLDIFFR